MKILYATYARLPTRKAYGYQIVKTCEALASRGEVVVLVAVSSNGSTAEDIYQMYGVKTKFDIHMIRIPKLYWLGKIGFWISEFIFAMRVKGYFHKESVEIVYSRDELPLLLAPGNIFAAYEAHTFFTITHGLKGFYQKKGVSAKLMSVVPDAVDISVFRNPDSLRKCRKRLKISEAKKIVTYAGHLYPEKGAHLLAESCQYISGDDVDVYIVGGLLSDRQSFQKTYGGHSRLHIIGYRSSQEIPLWLCASDILVLPNIGSSRVSAEFTSPLKLFEYMASGRPIIASRVPAIREILTDQDATFFNPGDELDLAAKIRFVFDHPAEALSKAKCAQAKAASYTWEFRAKKIIDNICLKQKNA